MGNILINCEYDLLKIEKIKLYLFITNEIFVILIEMVMCYLRIKNSLCVTIMNYWT